MTATGHALIGTIIAAKFTNPVIGIPLCILSHVVADSLPHWDIATHRREKTKTRLFLESGIDVTLGFAASFLLLHYFFPQTNLTYAFFCIIAAQMLDWITVPYLIFGIKEPIFYFAYKVQKSFDNKLDQPWGVVSQIAAIIFLVCLVRWF